MSTTTTTPTTGKCSICDKESTLKCSRCKLAFYCCKDHQLQHWKSGHKRECNDSYQADQYTLHKQEFDRIVKKYGLDTPENSERISTMLTSGEPVTPPAFAETFGTTTAEAVVFLEWIKVGVKFKEQAIDTAKNSGFGK